MQLHPSLLVRGVIGSLAFSLLAVAQALAQGVTANSRQIAILRWYAANQASISFPAGGNSYAVAFDGANIWVANKGTDDVTKLRASDGTLLGTFQARDGPSAVVFDGTKLRASDAFLLGTFSVGTEPYAVAFDGAYIWVVNSGSDNVSKL